MERHIWLDLGLQLSKLSGLRTQASNRGSSLRPKLGPLNFLDMPIFERKKAR
jgi:hypothetical protein